MIGSSITAKGTKSSAKFAKDLTDAKISLWTLRKNLSVLCGEFILLTESLTKKVRYGRFLGRGGGGLLITNSRR